MALEEPAGSREPQRITRIVLRYGGLERRATLVDAGDARVEVDPGDWAIVRVDVEVDVPSSNGSGAQLSRDSQAPRR